MDNHRLPRLHSEVLPPAGEGKSSLRESRDSREDLVSAHDETDEQQRNLGEGGPAEAVPEADSAEQHAEAAEESGQEDWVERAAGLPFDEGSEGDVVEQAMEAGTDDEEEYR